MTIMTHNGNWLWKSVVIIGTVLAVTATGIFRRGLVPTKFPS